MNTSINTTSINELERFIKDTLSPARYHHSRGVAVLAEKLANRFNLDPTLALIAGWAHDGTREWAHEKQKTAMEQLGRMTPDLVDFPMVWHGYTAAHHLHQSLGFYDESLDLAMQCHSIGHVPMSDLDKVLFVADYLEAGRSYVTVAHKELLTSASLNTLFAVSLHESIHHIKTQNQAAHPISLQLLTNYKEFL